MPALRARGANRPRLLKLPQRRSDDVVTHRQRRANPDTARRGAEQGVKSGKRLKSTTRSVIV
jgi:hypothetical protein